MGSGPPRIPRRSIDVPGTLTIDVYADVHVGAKGFLEKPFLKDLAETLEDPARYLVLNGDLFNAAMRDAKHGGVYQEAMPIDECLDWWEKALRGHQDKILGLVSGNHDKYPLARVGMDPVRELAARLGIVERYLIDGGYISTEHGNHGRHSRPIVYRGFYSHGTGSSPNSTNLQRVTEGFDADFYALGHTHTPMAISGTRYDLNRHSDTVTEHRWVAAVGGSYLAYEGYPLERRMRPRPTGRLTFLLAGDRHHVEVRTP